MRRQSGFTMTELVIAIAIMAVAAAVAVPSYLVWLPDIRLKGAARDLKSDLGLAKQRAVQENGQVAVAFSTGNDQYETFLDNGSGGGTPDNCNREVGEAVIRTVTMHDDVDMYSASFAGGLPCVSFDGRGLPNGGAGGTVRMRNAKNNFMGIDMTLVGLISIQRSTDGGGTWHNAD